ncbi:MAG: hypothetical protein R3277_00170 [Brumimicrobium sp.]|nr:hypothetical protein [Brumimicrobium sp.]
MVKPYSVMVGVLWNVVEDDGDRFANLFNVSDSWNYKIYPTSLNVDVYLKKGMSLDFIASYNYYDTSKLINNLRGKSGHFFSLDAHYKYSFGFLMRQQRFDPFVFAGVGYTGREAIFPQNMLSVNAGGGINIMIWAGLGLQIRTTAKVSMLPEIYSEDYDLLQHHFGLIYKIPEMTGGNDNFHKRKYKWGHKNYRYRKPKGM